MAAPKPLPAVGGHALMADHMMNMTPLQQRVCTAALDEFELAKQRIAILEGENGALLGDLARLTRKLHVREDAPKAPTNGRRQRARVVR